jgi:hypothetical protein
MSSRLLSPSSDTSSYSDTHTHVSLSSKNLNHSIDPFNIAILELTKNVYNELNQNTGSVTGLSS